MWSNINTDGIALKGVCREIFDLHRGVNNLLSVCFNPKFYKYYYEYYFSVMPKDINIKLIL